MLPRRISSFKAITAQDGNWIDPKFQQEFSRKKQGSESGCALFYALTQSLEIFEEET